MPIVLSSDEINLRLSVLKNVSRRGTINFRCRWYIRDASYHLPRTLRNRNVRTHVRKTFQAHVQNSSLPPDDGGQYDEQHSRRIEIFIYIISSEARRRVKCLDDARPMKENSAKFLVPTKRRADGGNWGCECAAGGTLQERKKSRRYPRERENLSRVPFVPRNFRRRSFSIAAREKLSAKKASTRATVCFSTYNSTLRLFFRAFFARQASGEIMGRFHLVLSRRGGYFCGCCVFLHRATTIVFYFGLVASYFN